MIFAQKNIKIYCLFILIFSFSALSNSFIDKLKNILSFKISEEIVDKINDKIIGKLSAKNIKYIVPNKIEMDDVEVLDEAGVRVLYAAHVKLAISLPSLLSKNITIADAVVEEPFFKHSIKKNVHNVIMAFSPPPAPKSAPSNMRVSIAHVRIKNGHYEMDHDEGVQIFAEGVDAEGKFFIEEGPFGIDIDRVSVKQGSILVGDLEFPLSSVIANRLWISHEKVSLANVAAFYGSSFLNGAGTVYIKEERYDLAAKLVAPKNTWPLGLKSLDFDIPSFDASINMKGQLRDPLIFAQIQHKDTNFYNLPIRQGTLKAEINKEHISIIEAALKIGQQGEAVFHGDIYLAKEAYEFNGHSKNIDSEDLASFVDIDRPSKGLIDAKLDITGKYTGNRHLLSINTQGNVKDGQFDEVHFAPQSMFDLHFSLLVDQYVRFHRGRIYDRNGLDARFNGMIDLNSDEANFDIDLHAEKINQYVPKLDEAATFLGLHAKGSLIKNKDLSIDAEIVSRQILFSKQVLEQVSAHLLFKDDALILENIKVHTLEGAARGNFQISNLAKSREINGYVSFKDINIAQAGKDVVKASLDGKLHGDVSINGTLSSPKLAFLGEALNFKINQLELSKINFSGEYQEHRLAIKEVLASSDGVSLVVDNLLIDMANKSISGEGEIAFLDIEKVFYPYVNHFKGELKGDFFINGNLSSPDIYAPLTASNISFFGFSLGNGLARFSFKETELLGPFKERDLVFSSSFDLAKDHSQSLLRFGLALNKKTINSEAEFSRVSFDLHQMPGFNLVGVKGVLSGHIAATGNMLSPTLSSELVAHEYSFFDPEPTIDREEQTKVLGPALLLANVNEKYLKVESCAFMEELSNSSSCFNDDISLKVLLEGPFSFDNYSLKLDSSINIKEFEQIFYPLKKEFIKLGVSADITGEFAKTPAGGNSYRLDLRLKDALASVPSLPFIKLSYPANLVFSDGRIWFEEEATLDFSPGSLSVDGAYAKEDLAINLHGTIPLMLAKFFLPIIQRADGMAAGTLNISGTGLKPIFDGVIRPEAGSLIAFKKWLEPVEIKEGALTFKKLSASSFVANFDDISLQVGDGQLLIAGELLKNYENQAQNMKSALNLYLEGSNILLKQGHQFIEADFKINTESSKSGNSVLKGSVLVSNGSVHRDFDLRNFVAVAKTSNQSMDLDFLQDLDTKIDLDISINQFKASARMLNLYLDTSLVGQLKAEGLLSAPKFKGGLMIKEGSIAFPSTTFELIATPVELNEDSAKPFDPQISIISTQVLDGREFRLSQGRDTTIEIGLKGDLDKLNLSLSAVAGDMSLNQFRIFLLLLSPRYGDENLGPAAKNAALAFSGEVFLRPLTNELQSLLEGKTNTQIQFGSALESGGISMKVNWKISPRVEVQGSYLYISEESHQRNYKAQSVPIDSYSLGDLKLILFLFDHRPLGPLFLENSFGANRKLEGNLEPRGKIRLKYTLLGF